MVDIILIILQVLIEFLGEIAGSALLDLSTWSWERDRGTLRACAVVLIMVVLGAVLGWLSTLLLPHAVLPWGWLRAANLFVAPLCSAWLAWRIARWRQDRQRATSPAWHAVIAGSACAGLVVMRLVLCAR